MDDNHFLDVDGPGGDLFGTDPAAGLGPIKNTTATFFCSSSLSSATGTAGSVLCFGSLSTIGSPPEPKPPQFL